MTARIDHAVTSGTFSLDGETFDVENNVWVVGDDYPYLLGHGGVGAAAVAGSRLAGAAKIIAIDIDDRKLATARELGATDVVNSRSTDPVLAVRDLTGGFGPTW